MPPEGRPGPFTELLARTIAEQSLSLAQVAKRIDRQAEKDGVRLAAMMREAEIPSEIRRVLTGIVG